MDIHMSRWIFDHWQRKLVAIVTALIIWIFVNNSITDTKTIPNIAVKVINLPQDKAIMGLLPNGLLSRRITLTLSGTKDVIADLEAGDIEVVLDASAIDSDEWIVSVNKKNLVSLNPGINLSQHITQVEHGDFVIKLSPLMTVRIPIVVVTPAGDPPSGYSFVDVWPQRLYQTVSATAEEIAQIEAKGLKLELNISAVNKSDLEAMQKNNVLGEALYPTNEVTLAIPAKWRKIRLSPYSDALVDINDPDAKHLQITFLQQQWLPLELKVPIRAFYPVKYLASNNPESLPLALSSKIERDHGVNLLKMPLYAYDISSFFLDRIKNFLEISIMVLPREETKGLAWSLNIIDIAELENTYTSLLMANEQSTEGFSGNLRSREELLRQRFRQYAHKLKLYRSPGEKLHLECQIENNRIEVR